MLLFMNSCYHRTLVPNLNLHFCFDQRQFRKSNVAFSWSRVDPDASAALSIPPQMLQAVTHRSDAATLSTCHQTGEVITCVGCSQSSSNGVEQGQGFLYPQLK